MICLDNSVLSRFASPKSYPAVIEYLSNRSSLPWTIPATVAYEYYSYFDTQEEVRIQQTKLDTHFDGILPVTNDVAAEAAQMEISPIVIL